jgi:hypothetical protein
MKNNQDGFAAVAFVIGATVLGVATMATQSYREQSTQRISEIEQERVRAQHQDAVFNAAGMYKALLSERKGSDGNYIPGMYAKNYFAQDWVLTNNPLLAASSEVEIDSSHNQVRLKSATSEDNVFAKSAKVFKGEQSAKSVSDEMTKVEIVDLRYSDDVTGLSAGIQVEFVDVKISSVSGTMAPVTVRVPVQVPLPRDVKMMYRAVGSPGWDPVTANMSLPPAKYEFQAKASGVLLAVATKYDGGPWVERGMEDGRPTHLANNYAASNADVGDPFVLDLAGSSSVDPHSCAYSAVDGSHKLEMQYYTVAGDAVSMPAIDIKVTGAVDIAGANLTLNDYRTQCAAPGQCPFIESIGLATHYNDGTIGAEDMAEYFQNHHNAGETVGSISGEWTFQEAKRYKLENAKICINLDNAGYGSVQHYFENLIVTTVKAPSCVPQFLFVRQACGCVAEDTKILMGDGKTEKAIKLISKGETIWNPLLKKAMPIRKMTVGPEKIPLLKVAVGDKILSVTGNHPFPTRSGMKTAFSLSDGEEIMVEGQGWVKISSITPVEAGAVAPNVWNIELEAPDSDEAAHHYVANGVVTGDLMIQVNLQKNAQTAQN